jgi:CubicO group peptidase (beta-lactamase class C family)
VHGVAARTFRDATAGFDGLAASHVGSDKIPGLVWLVAHGDDVHVTAAGSRSIGGPPVERDSLFRIASTTKPITAAATLALVDAGLIALDEPVARLLPELAEPRVLRAPDGPLDDTVPAERPVTTRDLLTFTFGFGMVMEMFMAPEPWPVVAREGELRLNTIGPPLVQEKPDPDTWMEGFSRLPLLAQPGERWLYNTGAHVLSVLCARAAGTSFGEVLRDRVFDPLGMRDTAFWTGDTNRLVTSYAPTPDGLVVWDPPDGAWSKPPKFEDGAAGLVSTVDDLLAFARMLLRGGDPVLSADSVTAMTSDQLSAEVKAKGGLGAEFFAQRSWGFGQAVTTDGPRAGAFGWDGGLGSSWLVDPARDLVVIVLSQRMWETSEPPSTHADLQQAAYDALFG